MIRSDRTAAPEVLTIVFPHLPFQSPADSQANLAASAADAYLAAHTISIRELETLTGLDLLPKLDAEALKQAVASELWPRN